MNHHDDHQIEAHISSSASDARRLLIAMILTGLFMLAEVAGGILSGSLALIADAGHMLSDMMALSLAWVAVKLSQRPADERRSFGYHRFQVIAAFLNGAILLGVVLWILIEAVERLLAPQPVLSGLMLGVAAVGLAVKIVVFLVLHRGSSGSINIKGALIHVLGDILGSVAAIGAALVIAFTGWTPIDPILSLLVSILIVRSAWLILRPTTHILMQGTPTHLDLKEIKNAIIREIPEVMDAHHLHAWALTPDRSIVTLHAQLREHADSDHVLKEIQDLLRKQFHLYHVTVQIETHICTDRIP